MKYVEKFIEHFSKTPVFSAKDADRFLIYNGAGSTYTKRFIYIMIKEGRIFRIAKGMYTVYDNAEVIGFAFSPFYYGLLYSLSYYDIWEERANTEIVTTRIVRSGEKKSLDTNISVFRIPRRFFFGYSMVKGDLFYYPISDLEKTFIDIIYFRINIRQETMKKLVSKLNKKKLYKYVSVYPISFRIKVKSIFYKHYANK